MQLLNNMNVGKKIVLLVFLLLLCIAAVAGVGIFELRKLDSESNILYEQNMLALSAAKEANIQLINQSRSLRNMVLVPSGRPAYITAYEGYTDKIREELEQVRIRLITPAAQATFNETLKAFEAMLPEQEEIIGKLDSR